MTQLFWPPGVNMNVLRAGYSCLPAADMLRSEMERDAKQRRFTTGAPDRLTIPMRFKRAEYLAFTRFIETEVKPAQNPYFLFPHPDDGALRKCKFVAQDGRLFIPAPAPAGGRFVNFTLDAYPLETA